MKLEEILNPVKEKWKFAFFSRDTGFKIGQCFNVAFPMGDSNQNIKFFWLPLCYRDPRLMKQ